MADHRLALRKRPLRHGCDAQHGMEQLAVGNRVQREFLDRVRMLLHALFAQLHNHFWDLQPTAANLLAAPALKADALDLLGTLAGDQEMGQQRADAAGINVRAVNMPADQRKRRVRRPGTRRSGCSRKSGGIPAPRGSHAARGRPGSPRKSPFSVWYRFPCRP